MNRTTRATGATRTIRTSTWVLLMIVAIITPCAAAPCFAASPDAALAGVVRDAHGTPQMGALIQLLGADAATVATAFTDNHGRYLIAAVIPGRYRLRASAAFFVPATRDNLRLDSGAEAIVNMTMSTLFESENWLPAQTRRADEPSDDWKWTLRSTASRPLLRLSDANDDSVLISSSSEHSHQASTQSRVTVTNGDGAFGGGGVHQVLVIDREMEDGDGAILRADVGEPSASLSGNPSSEVVAGYERRSPMGGNTRLVAGFQSHPEVAASGVIGAQALRLASAQEVQLGDMVLIDGGTLMMAERLASARVMQAPFVRIDVRPSSGTLIEYRYAVSRELQSSDDLDRLKPQMTLLIDANGHPLSPNGGHEELSLSQKLGHRVLEISAYTGHIDHAGVGGSGILAAADLEGAPLLADATTGTFRVATNGFEDQGVSVSLMQPLTQALSIWIAGDLGSALLRSTDDALPLASIAANLQRHSAEAASVAIRGKIIRSGTSMRAEYRWQPLDTVTQVNSYNTATDDAYLSFYLRQRVWCGRFLPDGVDAVVEATNLLEQGYQPLISADGHTIFLAQVPRAIEGGFAFNF